MARKITAKFKVAITNDMEIGFFAENTVSPEDGKLVLAKLIELLGVDDIELSGVAEIEQHVNQDRLERVHHITHEHSHSHD